MIALSLMLKIIKLMMRLILTLMSWKAVWLIWPVVVRIFLVLFAIYRSDTVPRFGMKRKSWNYSREDWMMKSSKTKKLAVIDDGVNCAPCKMYRFRVKFKDSTSKDLISPPYAFHDDKDAMKWVNDTCVRLLDDVKAIYSSIGCYCFGACDVCGKLTFSDEKLIGTVTRNDVLSAMALKLEGYKNA